MKTVIPLISLSALVTGTAQASDMTISVEIPKLGVAEYHKPYVAVWIARPDHSVAKNLSVWYQLDDGKEGHGETWLKDMRLWWRRTGRSLSMPVDGVSSPTKASGEHNLQFDAAALASLEAGDYVLYVEAAREVGGREVVSIPFSWSETAMGDWSKSGESELGAVTLKIKPRT